MMLIGLATAVLGVIAIVMGMLGKTLAGNVQPENRATHKILLGVVGGFLTLFGLWLAFIN
jgi:threonine/homoserine/homoserine lactone efflux protein